MNVVCNVVDIVTSAAGAGVGYTNVINGRVLTIRYIKPQSGGYAAGVDIDVETEHSGIVIWSQDDVNASATVCPRQATHDTAGVEDNGNDGIFVANERLKITVADGGDNATGQFVVLAG